MANKFRSKLFYGRTGIFYDAVGIGTDAINSGLIVSGGDFNILNGNAYFENRPIVSGFSQVALLNDITGGIDFSNYYLSSNPSGFITGVDLSNYITNSHTGQFYPASNPSGFLTAATVSGSYVSSITGNISGAIQIKNMIRITQSGYNALTPDAETFYIIVG